MGISCTGFYSHAWLFLRWCIWNWGVFLSAVICPAPMCVGESYCGLLIGNQKMMLWSTTVGLWELLATTISNESLSDMTLVEIFTDKLMFERFIPVRWVRFAHFHPLTHRTFPGDQIETNLTFFDILLQKCYILYLQGPDHRMCHILIHHGHRLQQTEGVLRCGQAPLTLAVLTLQFWQH